MRRPAGPNPLRVWPLSGYRTGCVLMAQVYCPAQAASAGGDRDSSEGFFLGRRFRQCRPWLNIMTWQLVACLVCGRVEATRQRLGQGTPRRRNDQCEWSSPKSGADHRTPVRHRRRRRAAAAVVWADPGEPSESARIHGKVCGTHVTILISEVGPELMLRPS